MEFESESFFNKKRLILIVIILIFLFFLIKREKIHKKITSTTERTPAFVFESAKVIELKKGKDIWKFNVSKAIINREKNKLKLYKLNGNFVKDGVRILEVNTPGADLDLKYSNLILFGGKISTLNAPKRILTADKITWISKEETLSGTGNVRLIQDNMMLKSSSFTADGNLKKIKVRGNPEVIIEE